ncbi:N-acetylmuramoyl-L-alanine amidase LytC precursor [Peptoniphilus harei]|uniref:N-acetylmuramoyl-L-alanine amidase n=1 Tax=Peptoniphilus harei TaxID=54005 RepID=UPI000F71E3CC|nr:N-acetylmuramoyl-L-alanine amidase [Peptoniphilus harei]QQE47512.1 N-acetylmuramoyl-L-alanine amidase [Peptoniphilus harei]VEJ33918.1 N-acetylmuramoyl-L-alanine amidase LytC precursor [Peptoniphilus harei]
MKKIIKISMLSLALLITPVFANNLFKVSIGRTQFQVKKAGVLVNNRTLKTEFSPYIKQGRTFVPIREITENLGADVKWNNRDKSIKISLNGDVIDMKINSPNVRVNGKKISLDNAQAPQLAIYSSPRKETKTMVPLRFISETFGYDVDWNNDKVRAEISTNKTKSIVEDDKKENSNKNNKNTKNNKSNNKNTKKVASKTKTSDSKSIFDSNYFQSNVEKSETNKITKEIKGGNKDKIFDQAELDKSDEKKNRVIKDKIEVNGKLKIVIDPGHGGKDSGAVALDGETYEKTVNLLVAERLMDKLSANSEISPTITRTRDEYIKLLDRAGVSNDGDAHLFLSIHFNSADNSSAKGIEVLYASEKNVRIKDTVQKDFASCLQKALIKETGAVDRGIKNRPAIIVLNKTKNVAALAELGFLSNEDDLENIKDPDYIDKLAQGLYNGIEDYMNTFVEK